MISNHLSKKIILEISKILGPIPAKETILAVLGYKTSRLGVHPKYYNSIIALFKQFDIKYVIGNYRYTYKLDVGKGGWSNKFGDETYINDKNSYGDYFFYIADNIEKAKISRDNEETEQEAEFGETLGIPSCCADFYVDNADKAMEKQNDFVTLVLENTYSDPPYNYWNNYVAQYFGYSLLSFFPCSFDCKESIIVSKQIYNILYDIYPEFSDQFLYYHKQNILYTEYRGIYLFENTKYDKENIVYNDSRIHSSIKNSSIYKTIMQSNRFVVHNKNHCMFFNKMDFIRQLKGENIALCLFN